MRIFSKNKKVRVDRVTRKDVCKTVCICVLAPVHSTERRQRLAAIKAAKGDKPKRVGT